MNILKIVFINKNNLRNVLFLFIFFAVGGGLFWVLKTSETQKIPDSCYLSPLAITIEVVRQNYSDCKTDIQSLEADINFEKTDQKISKLTTQLKPKEQLTLRTEKVVESIFQEIRDDISSEPILNIIIFSICLILFFLWCLCFMFLLIFFIFVDI
ncbi:hypothetical protein cce_5060 [Crocosphaera subtropica ATCC 51142]|uniref:Uncharacterized protein n=1 Tax=Crocosphaera subtropica (strain ATCC 51142 / BH68) TaxID=43989 RepID=B1X2P5_CROS5|nr:hypothetical protein [Crocosphaera subtropica]ACB54406.1 hypothetical protein cce_5060 [Crocosphaera subtropica ATCC 51142]